MHRKSGSCKLVCHDVENIGLCREQRCGEASSALVAIGRRDRRRFWEGEGGSHGSFGSGGLLGGSRVGVRLREVEKSSGKTERGEQRDI